MDSKERPDGWVVISRAADLRTVIGPALVVLLLVVVAIVVIVEAVWGYLWVALLAAPVMYGSLEHGLTQRAIRLNLPRRSDPGEPEIATPLPDRALSSAPSATAYASPSSLADRLDELGAEADQILDRINRGEVLAMHVEGVTHPWAHELHDLVQRKSPQHALTLTSYKENPPFSDAVQSRMGATVDELRDYEVWLLQRLTAAARDIAQRLRVKNGDLAGIGPLSQARAWFKDELLTANFEFEALSNQLSASPPTPQSDEYDRYMQVAVQRVQKWDAELTRLFRTALVPDVADQLIALPPISAEHPPSDERARSHLSVYRTTQIRRLQHDLNSDAMNPTFHRSDWEGRWKQV